MPSRVPSAVAAVLFASLLALAFFIPVRLTHGGGRTLEGWSVAMVGLAGLCAALTWPTSWRRVGSLTALLVLGCAAQLALTRPLWLMSVRVLPGDFTDPLHVLAAATIAVQALVVLGLTLSRLRAFASAAAGLLTLPRLIGCAVLFLFCAAQVSLVYPDVFALSYDLKRYVARVGAVAFLFAVNLLHLLLIARAAPERDMARRWGALDTRISLPGSDRPPTRLDRPLPWILAAAVFVVTVVHALVVFRGVPHIPDEAAYLFQARTLASGALSVPAPPVPEAFDLYLLVAQGGRWYIVTHPGWPALLALGVLIGMPWIVNPLLGALTIPLAHRLTRRLTDHGTAHAVALLLATSPWFLALSAAYQPHAVTLLLTLIGWWGVTETRRRDRTWPAAIAGLAAGVVFTIRPLDGLLLGTLTGALFLFPGRLRPAPVRALAYGAGCVATGSLMLAFNRHFTGSFTEFPINAYLDRLWGAGANRLGFGADVGQLWGVLDPIPGHGIKDVLLNTNQNLYLLNYELLGWCVGSLALLALHLFWGRLSRLDRLFLFFLAALYAVYSLYWFSGGPDYGPRYWFLMIYPLLFLSVRGARTLVEVLSTRLPTDWLRPRVALVCGVLVLTGVGVFVPWRAVGKYVDLREQHTGFRDLAARGAFGDNGIVVVETESEAGYASAFFLNDLTPGKHGPLYVRDQGCAMTARVVEAYPGRPLYHARATFAETDRVIEVEKVDLPLACEAD